MTPRRSALVTGASRGIGLTVARRLAAEGFDLTIAARSQPALDGVATQLRALGVDVSVVPADMADDAAVTHLAAAHHTRYGRADLVVLSAGMGIAGPLDSYPIRHFDTQMRVNVRGPLLLVQHLLPALRAAADGPHGARVVAIASITGVVSEPGLAAYGATKAALISLCESINVADGTAGVSGTAISPGYVDTDMTTWVKDTIGAESMLVADDIAEMVCALSRLSRNAVVPNIIMSRQGPMIWRA